MCKAHSNREIVYTVTMITQTNMYVERTKSSRVCVYGTTNVIMRRYMFTKYQFQIRKMFIYRYYEEIMMFIVIQY